MKQEDAIKEDKPPGGRKKLKIILLYNSVEHLERGLPRDLLPEEDTVDTAKDVAKALRKLGHQVMLFPITEKSYGNLPKLQADLFFNLAEGVGSLPHSEYRIPKILEKMKVNFTGATSKNILDTTDKGITKRVLVKNNVLTPSYRVFKNGFKNCPKKLKFPLFVKPLAEDCSVGIFGSKAVVLNRRSLKNRVKFIHQHYQQPALVEQFINTREVTVTVIGNGKNIRALPISEIIFGKYFDKNRIWKIHDFSVKWQVHTKKYQQAHSVCPADLPENLVKKIQAASVKAYKLLGCRDYARIDIRIDEDNKFYILEINSNPSIANLPSYSLMRSARAAGYNYEEFINFIVTSSLKRRSN